MTEWVDYTGDALAFAYQAHEGQLYKGQDGIPDEPYILHPMRVALTVPSRCQVVAILHDCKEDAGVLPEWLNDEERRAIELLTRDKETETYTQYIERIANAKGRAADVARLVKCADLRDNLNHSPGDRLRERYESALRRLNSVMVNDADL